MLEKAMCDDCGARLAVWQRNRQHDIPADVLTACARASVAGPSHDCQHVPRAFSGRRCAIIAGPLVLGGGGRSKDRGHARFPGTHPIL